ncbi:unnamed protein product [Didymodactylos carnosus]|uniref:CCHC-type domain-containing protein n=1 Tax=Didymodactylos carnosus TaxID=1234261 RepID=A0A8S2D2G2_9BILA|nr:unnamed protein product [Didymodactylos carnosus]CAF3646312.1 unnamed protein product [Didymodactylos carnosus]
MTTHHEHHTRSKKENHQLVEPLQLHRQTRRNKEENNLMSQAKGNYLQENDTSALFTDTAITCNPSEAVATTNSTETLLMKLIQQQQDFLKELQFQFLTDQQQTRQQLQSQQNQIDRISSSLNIMDARSSTNRVDTEPKQHKTTANKLSEELVLGRMKSMINDVRPFYGLPSEKPTEWLEDMDYTLNNSQLNDEQKMWLVPTFLKDGARIWHESNKQQMRDWQQFKALFRRQFVSHLSVTDKLLLANQLNNRRQALNEPVTQYYHDMMKLCRQYDPDMDDAERRTKLLNGLKVELLDKILPQPMFGTTNDLLLALQQIEAGQKFTSQRMNDSTVIVEERPAQSTTMINPSSEARSANHRALQSSFRNNSYQQRQQYENSSQPSTAPYLRGHWQQQGNCFRCGGFGHYAKHCPSPLN